MTTMAKRAFRCTAPAIWNSLPRTVLDSDTVTSYKSRLKTHLFSEAFSHTPTPLKLRPYGAIQIRLLILLLSDGMKSIPKPKYFPLSKMRILLPVSLITEYKINDMWKNMSTTIAKLKNGILHTSKIGNLLPVCLRNNRYLADHISKP